MTRNKKKKDDIVRYHIQNPDMKNLDLIALFENEFKIKISPATISRILNKFNLNDDTYDTDSNQLNIQSL